MKFMILKEGVVVHGPAEYDASSFTEALQYVSELIIPLPEVLPLDGLLLPEADIVPYVE